jgi:hypothetical protein
MTPKAISPRFFSLVVLLIASMTAACSPDPTPTKTAAQCATDLFPSYNPKDREQCIAACIKCEKGVMTTCATSCNLKGAK